MPPKCIIFDCDGVLVDSEAITNQVLIDMSKELGLTVTPEHADIHFTGTALNTIIQWIEDNTGKPLPADFETSFRSKTFELFKTDIKPIKGVAEVLAQVNVPIGVASSGPLNKIKLNLTTTGLIDHFGDNIFSCYDIGSWKPSPKIFEHAARTLGFEPKDCVVVEDSVAGVTAARTGGFKVFGYAEHGAGKALADAGAIVFHNMENLPALIGLDTE